MSRTHKSRASKVNSKSGLTRREFLTEHALPTMTALAMSPLLEGLFRSENAMAEGSPASSFMPFAHIHLEGGWGFNGTFGGKNAAGELVSRETMKQHGIAVGYGDPTATMISTMGGLLYPATVSSFTNGLLNATSAATQANTRIFIYHSESPDDNSSANDSGLSPLFTLAGFNGLLASMLGPSNSPSGNDTQALASNPAMQRYTMNRAGDFINSLAFSRVLTNHSAAAITQLANSIRDLSSERIARMSGGNAEEIRTASQKAAAEFITKAAPAVGTDTLNPTTDPTIAVPFGLTATTTNNVLGRTDNATIQATMVKAALEGNSGPIAFNMRGYDYHATAKNTTDQRNQTAGQMVGRFLQAAANKGKPMAIWLTTDGGLAANLAFVSTDGNSSQFQGDRSRYSGAMLAIYNPTPLEQTLTNIGNVDDTNGMLNPTTVTGQLKMASAHVFYNLALLAGKATEGEMALANAGYSRAQIDAIKAMPTLFKETA